MSRGLDRLARSSERQSSVTYSVVKIISIASNTFLESIRQPIFAIILLTAAAMIAISPHITFFTLFEGVKQVKDMGLATVLLAGMLLGAFSASSVISHEIENRTVLTVISKPVDRMEFILGKFLGVAGGIILATTMLSLCLLLSAASGASEGQLENELNWTIAGLIFISIFLAICYGLYMNFFADRPFCSRVIGAMTPLFAIVFLVLLFYDPRNHTLQPIGKNLDWQLVYGCMCVLWSVLLMSAVAIAVSTRLTVTINVVICGGVFVLGLVSDHFLKKSTVLAGKVLYRIVPNLNALSVADPIQVGYRLDPTHVWWCGLYAGLMILGFLFMGMLLFERRQVS